MASAACRRCRGLPADHAAMRCAWPARARMRGALTRCEACACAATAECADAPRRCAADSATLCSRDVPAAAAVRSSDDLPPVRLTVSKDRSALWRRSVQRQPGTARHGRALCSTDATDRSCRLRCCPTERACGVAELVLVPGFPCLSGRLPDYRYLYPDYRYLNPDYRYLNPDYRYLYSTARAGWGGS
jgi:hypothetical protein